MQDPRLRVGGYCKALRDIKLGGIEVNRIGKTHQLLDPLIKYGVSSISTLNGCSCVENFVMKP